MSEGNLEASDLNEVLETAAAAELLARDPEAFKEAFEAYEASDADRFHAVLERMKIDDRCRVICHLFCWKRCGAVCRVFCPGKQAPVDADEIREFAIALAGLAAEEGALERLLKIIAAEDAEAWREEIERRKLGRFCYQLCHVLCKVHCKRKCHGLCPPRPLITNIGSIPTPIQVDALGYGSGLGVPYPQVPAPTPGGGVGHHVWGDSPWIKGVFNKLDTVEYKVEIAPHNTGLYTPVAGPVYGTNNINAFPWVVPNTRTDTLGWYKVSEISDSDGGPTTTGEKLLVTWRTWVNSDGTPRPDGLYDLRLRVRDVNANERVSAVQLARIDNTVPPKPTIKLEQLTPNGPVALKCGEAKRSNGLIRVTVQAFDTNFSRLSVEAQGNSGLSIPVVGVPVPPQPNPAPVPLSKTYNGNIADHGYPVPTSFDWDPWSDPQFVPCCYVVRIDIWDRALSSNWWGGGHGNAGWEAISLVF